MTPDRARYLIHAYKVLELTGSKEPEDLDALETIAGMQEEFGYEYEALHGLGRTTRWGFSSRYAADADMQTALRNNWEEHQPTCIVMRYVTKPEPLGERP